MTAVVFIGPTISQDEVLSIVDAICLPPVAQGDVYRAMRHTPTSIGIIDGYFDGVAAVWHKEILWALSQGVHVFGTASMGALRAAELADFGMKGIGTIYDQFRNGTFENDDEVAVVHGPAEIGYPALSEPLVNIRATLVRAVEENVLQQAMANELTQIAKSTQYRQRTWDSLIKGSALPDQFTNWLKDGRIDQKHQDAIAMLQALAEKTSGGGSKHLANFDFEWTNQWDHAISHWDKANRTIASNDQYVLDELRLQPDAYYAARDAAMIRFTLNHQNVKTGKSLVEKNDLINEINEFRREHNLLNRAQLDQWLHENRLTTSELENLLADEVRLNNSIDFASEIFTHCLINHLKLTGDYNSLATGAKTKRDKLGQFDHRPLSTGLPNPALLEWYFCQRYKTIIPSNIDDYVFGLGLQHRDDLYQMLAREYLYLHGGQGE